MQFPRLKAHYASKIVNGTKVFLLGDERYHVLATKGVAQLAPLLDGTRTLTELVSATAGQISFTDVALALRRLTAAGVLAEGRPDLEDAELAFWDQQGIDPHAIVAARQSTTVLVVGLGRTLPEVFAQLLGEQGLIARAATEEEVLDAGSSDIVVALTDDYLDPQLSRLNEGALRNGRPWVLARPAGTQVWIGPVIRPDTTGCWLCLRQRLAGNRQVERYVGSKQVPGSPVSFPARAGSTAGLQVVAGLLGSQLTRLAATCVVDLDATMVTVELASMKSERHELVRQPQCAACGDPRLVSDRDPRLVIGNQIATWRTDGGYRVNQPHETLDRLAKHISPYLGAVSSVRPHEEDDNGITYSFTAGHNFAMVNDNMDLLRRNLRGQSGGKGRSEIQARVSAVCEAIERYSGVWRGDEPVVRAAYQDLDPVGTVHPDELLNFSASQRAAAKAWNADPKHQLHLVPDQLANSTVIDWSRAWSLTHDGERLIPAGYAWYGQPDLGDCFYCVTDSNGSASGNVLEEAILQGFCEIVERDAVAVWWYNRCLRPGFDLDSLDEPYVSTLRTFYDSMDRDIWVLDITTDLGVPTFAAVSRRRAEVEDVMIGFGAHVDVKIAIMRALTELNQFLPFVNRRDDSGQTIYRTDDADTLDWCRTVTVAAEPWLTPSPHLTPRTVADYPTCEGTDLAGHVLSCVERAKACGLEVIVLDQTRPDLELSVVRVVVPGMRHFWRRLGAGRLYDVPVALGWLDAPRTEQEMNPRNVFF